MVMRLVAAISWFLLSTAVIGCNTESDESAPASRSGINQPDRIMTNSEIFLTNEGRRKATIKSDLLKAYTRIDTTLLYVVEVRFYDSTGVQTSTLTADSGRVSQRTNMMSVAGHVRAWTSDDKRLVTDSLRWDANKDKVVTEGFVEVFRGTDKISGNGLETDQRLEKVVIKRNPRGSFDESNSDHH